MVRLNQILNRMIIQCDDGCTYLNSSFSSTYITVMYKGGSIGIGHKNRLEDECEVIVVSSLDNQFLIAISRYCESEKLFDTYFFQKIDLESELNFDVSERQLAVIKAVVERRFKCYCHARILQEM